MSGLMVVGHSAEAIKCRFGTYKPDITNFKTINVGDRRLRGGEARHLHTAHFWEFAS